MMWKNSRTNADPIFSMPNNVNLIVALASNNAIGREGDLLFHLSPDLRHFKEVTMGHPIVMGRKTFESFPKGPLPGRRNIIVSRNRDYKVQGAEVYPSLEEALEAAGESDSEVFVIGGGEIYRQAFPFATRLFLTHIYAPAENADTFFPEIDPCEWIETDMSDTLMDEKSGLAYSFSTLSRRCTLE